MEVSKVEVKPLPAILPSILNELLKILRTLPIPIGTNMDLTDDNILCPELGLKLETEFTILGFEIENKLANLNATFKKCTAKVKALITK